MKYRPDNPMLQDMGPWLVQADGQGSFIVQEHTHTESYGVDEDGQKCRWSRYTEAKARLIAAAPDLLEALQLCLKALRHEIHHADTIRMDAEDAAAAAIAKATGEKI